MPQVDFKLSVFYPDEIDSDVLGEIMEDADDQDVTLAAKIERWLGGLLGDAEQMVEDNLPEGWSVEISS